MTSKIYLLSNYYISLFPQDAYSDFAAFFYNPCGGKEIAVIWKPTAFDAKEFKVNDVSGCSLTADKKRIQAKKDVLIEDFKFILKDFYLRMGSVESIKQANQKTSSASDVPNKIGNKRYFASNAKEEQPKPFVKKPKTDFNKKLSKPFKKPQPQTKSTELQTKPKQFVKKQVMVKTDQPKKFTKSFKPEKSKKQKLKTSFTKKTAKQ